MQINFSPNWNPHKHKRISLMMNNIDLYPSLLPNLKKKQNKTKDVMAFIRSFLGGPRNQSKQGTFHNYILRKVWNFFDVLYHANHERFFLPTIRKLNRVWCLKIYLTMVLRLLPMFVSQPRLDFGKNGWLMVFTLLVMVILIRHPDWTKLLFWWRTSTISFFKQWGIHHRNKQFYNNRVIFLRS